MTSATDPIGVSSDRVDADSRRWPATLAAIVAGLIIGALVGLIVAASGSPARTATTAVSVLPDPTLDITSSDGTNSNVPTQDATSYIQSQLVVINGQQLAERVQAQGSLAARPAVTATQVGQTYVVSITATAGSTSEAVQVARLTATLYAQERTRQLTSEITGLVRSTNQQLTSVRSSLGSAPDTNSGTLTPSQTALQTEYQRLLSVRSSLAATQSQASGIVTVVSPAHASDTGLSSSTRDTLIGALIGAILAAIALAVLRRAVPRVRGAGDLAALDVPVLLPVQPRRPVSRLRRTPFTASGQARLLAARLHAGLLEEHRALVVIGTDPGVGASLVATSVAVSLASRGSVLLVRQRAAAPSPVVAPATTDSEQLALPDMDLEPHERNATPLSDYLDLTTFPPAFDTAFAPEAHADPAPTPVGVAPSTVPGVWLLDVASTQDLAAAVHAARQAGWLVIVDADPLSDSDAGLDCARDGAALALVAGRGRSHPAAVLAAVELFDADRTPWIGVVLNDVPGPLGRLLAGRVATEITSLPGGEPVGIDAPPWVPEPRLRAGGTGPRPRPSTDGYRRAARHSVLATRR